MQDHRYNNIALLKDRALMLRKARDFFFERGVFEIDSPILNAGSNIDDYIDPIQVTYCKSKKGCLHTSPELFLKKLLAKGSGDIYFLGHVFRDHESGELHSVEFTMVEWYRLELCYEEMIEETLAFASLFISNARPTVLTYRSALLKFTGLDYLKTTRDDLIQYLKTHLNVSSEILKGSWSDLLTVVFTEKVESGISELGLVAIKDYPKEQAALAKVKEVDGHLVAQRFEVYYQGVELANGYDELRGAEELLKRYQESNQKRRESGKSELPIDAEFIKANDDLPQCTGVAVGFDRLMMLKHKLASIHSTMSMA